jgi:hypothetical protein
MFAWYFWILVCCTGAIAIIVEPKLIIELVIKRQSHLSILIQSAFELLMIILTLVYLKTWWVLRRDKLSAGAWCISASVVSLLFATGFPSLDLIGGHFSDFWRLARFFAVPVSIGIAGVWFGFTDAAKPLPSRAVGTPSR